MLFNNKLNKNNMENKIYCKDCKYFMSYNVGHMEYLNHVDCRRIEFKKNEEKSNMVGEDIGAWKDVGDLLDNKNNNCPYFKKASFWDRLFK